MIHLLNKENKLYSIHYRLIPYMRLKAECDYATALNETKMWPVVKIAQE